MWPGSKAAENCRKKIILYLLHVQRDVFLHFSLQYLACCNRTALVHKRPSMSDPGLMFGFI